MSFEPLIRVRGVGKEFDTYEFPLRRLQRGAYARLAALPLLPPALRGGLLQRSEACVQRFQALADVSFDVGPGETVGIIGANGAGKSTLLQIICGTLSPSSGEVVTRGRIAALLELGAGFEGEYSGRENVVLNARLLGMSPERLQARMDDILAFADIGEFIERPVKTYSSGMVVRLAFSVITHVDADILVIDEALAVGDAHFNQKCMRFLHEFKRQGALLFVSHDPNAVRSLCDRAVWLDSGRIAAEGNARDVSTRYFESIYRREGNSMSPGPGRAKALAGKARGAPAGGDQRKAFTAGKSAMTPVRTLRIEPAAWPASRAARWIEDVTLSDAAGTALLWFNGGERVTLVMRFRLPDSAADVCACWIVKDRLGQVLFGDDDGALVSPGERDRGEETFTAAFGFFMPFLPAGEYAISVALMDAAADATVLDHVHDAWILHSQVKASVGGLLGVPMRRVDMAVREPGAE